MSSVDVNNRFKFDRVIRKHRK